MDQLPIKNIMELIDIDDLNLLNNKRIQNMSRMDWAKTMSIPNQWIHTNILRYMLEPLGYLVYSCDDLELPKYIEIKNNSPGFDIVIINKKDKLKYIRIQSKLRQIKGLTDTSTQVDFETTRRNSNKNKDKNHTGHVAYSTDEFDFVMISLVNDKYNRDKIKDCNLWSYVLIPTQELIDKKHPGCCITKIPPKILKNNFIKITDNIESKINII